MGASGDDDSSDMRARERLKTFESKQRTRLALPGRKELIAHLSTAMAQDEQETMRVVYLDDDLCLLAVEVLFTGSSERSEDQPRLVLRRALELKARAFALAHNHPSGNPDPSTIDLQLTRRIAMACEALDIHLLDHIVVTAEGSRSLKFEGYL